ncbi:MAG: hypothetical protein KDK23_03230 [Leptospiraceae bacterium]|nr:hypothetical protein [Leptospiraceae bacterium]
MLELIAIFFGTILLLAVLFGLPLFVVVKLISLSRRVNELERKIQGMGPDAAPYYRQFLSPSVAEQTLPPKSPSPAWNPTGPASDRTAQTRQEDWRSDSPVTVPSSPSAERPPAFKDSVAASRSSIPSGPQASPEDRKAPQTPRAGEDRSPALPGPWKKLEEALAANWTGILGTAILVVGAGFLGIYAALMMGAFARFLMILGLAGSVFAVSQMIGRKAHWKELSYWLRSGGGAILLLACVGTAVVPALQWIKDEKLLLVLILAGVAVNLGIAWFSSAQTFASIHTSLSVLALLILPRSALLFAIIGGIGIFSTYLSYRAKWEFHLLQSVFAFFIANAMYALHFGPATEMPVPVRIIGIAATGLIGALALLLHYRKPYHDQVFERWPFLSHMASWATLAVGFALYSTQSKYNTPILFLAATLVYFHARRARKQSIGWLYRTDSIMSLFIALLAAMTLGRWGWDMLGLLVLCSGLLMAFSVAANEEKERFLKTVGSVLLHLSWLILSLAFAVLLDQEKLYYQVSLLLLLLVEAVLLVVYNRLRSASDEELSLNSVYGLKMQSALCPAGFFAGVFVGLLAYYFRHQTYAEYALPLLALGLLALRHRGFPALVSAYGPALIGLHFLIALRYHSLDPWPFFISDLPLLLLLLAGILLSGFDDLKSRMIWQARIATGLLSLHVAFLSYTVSEPYSGLLPGVIWLLLSLIFLEIHRLTAVRRSGMSLAAPVWFIAGLGFAALFLIAHFFVHLQSETLLGTVRARLLIQILATGAFLYWALSNPAPQKYDKGILRRIPSFFWEMALLLISVAASLELGSGWLPVVWILLALGLRFASQLSFLPGRFDLYAIFYFWVAALHTGFLSGASPMPESHWADRVWIAGLISIAGQIAFLLLQYFRWFEGHKSSGEGATSNSALDWLSQWMEPLKNKLEIHKDGSIFYPLFFSVALFLYWSFDHSLLTILWMLEVLVVFSIGLKLGRNHFRYTAQGALILCVGRLILYDMSQSSIVMRAIAFLGVGAIMILMNAIYHRFRADPSHTGENPEMQSSLESSTGDSRLRPASGGARQELTDQAGESGEKTIGTDT